MLTLFGYDKELNDQISFSSEKWTYCDWFQQIKLLPFPVPSETLIHQSKRIIYLNRALGLFLHNLYISFGPHHFSQLWTCQGCCQDLCCLSLNEHDNDMVVKGLSWIKKKFELVKHILTFRVPAGPADVPPWYIRKVSPKSYIQLISEKCCHTIFSRS